MKLLLDTNIHSKWADRTVALASDDVRRLEAIVRHPKVDLIVPGPEFMEFPWPTDKQERWANRVVDIASSIALLAEDPVAWDLLPLLCRVLPPASQRLASPGPCSVQCRFLP